MRVLPSTSGSSLFVVVGEGCTANDPDTCGNDRGWLYDFAKSSSVVQRGIYSLPMLAEAPWGLGGNGQFGFDAMTLSHNGGGGPVLNNTLFAGIATKSIYIGTMGLTPWGTNFTDFNEPIPSLLTSLKDQGYLESNSWGYTAGMHGTEGYGSLTIGGYDESRFEANGLVIPRGQDISRDLLVGVQSILSGSQNLLPAAITAYIDSTIAQIWLPEAACKRFEEVFGLIWDERVKLYLVNETLHESLVASNPSITFAIGSTTTSADTVNINFPYSAFDHTAKAPLTANGTSQYFPLRRATNATQYLLGRTFLQQAYLTVDYDRSTFSVAQALFPDPGVPQKLVAISPPGQEGSQGLTTGVIVGIAVAVGAIVIGAVLTALWWLRRRRARGNTLPTAELPVESKVDGDRPEMKHCTSELSSGPWENTKAPSKTHTSELSSGFWGGSQPSELRDSSVHGDKVELDGRAPPSELPGSGQVRYELPG